MCSVCQGQLGLLSVFCMSGPAGTLDGILFIRANWDSRRCSVHPDHGETKQIVIYDSNLQISIETEHYILKQSLAGAFQSKITYFPLIVVAGGKLHVLTLSL